MYKPTCYWFRCFSFKKQTMHRYSCNVDKHQSFYPHTHSHTHRSFPDISQFSRDAQTLTSSKADTLTHSYHFLQWLLHSLILTHLPPEAWVVKQWHLSSRCNCLRCNKHNTSWGCVWICHHFMLQLQVFHCGAAGRSNNYSMRFWCLSLPSALSLYCPLWSNAILHTHTHTHTYGSGVDSLIPHCALSVSLFVSRLLWGTRL